MKQIKKSLLASAVVAALGYGGAAAAEVSGSVAFTTDYVFRGVSQTDSAPAVQGSFGYEHASGVYASIWGSSVDDGIGAAGLEYDLTLGFAKTLDNGLGFDVGIVNYRYPGGDTGTSVDVSEYYAGVSYSVATLKYYVGDSDLNANYLDLSASFELPEGFGVSLHVGQTDPDVGTEVVDYSVSLTKSLAGLDFALTATDTDIDNPTDAQDSRVFLSVSKSF